MASSSSNSGPAIEAVKLKRVLNELARARGNGTSMISLIVPPGEQLVRVTKMLAEEAAAAANIKSRVNRQSVLDVITSVRQWIKQHQRIPDNGLVVYCGTVVSDEGKEKKTLVGFEPFRPINTSLYTCDSRFHTEPLADLLASDEAYGFIVMDGNGALFGTLRGVARTVIHKMAVDLPKKHGRGGQSAVRFARLREEARHTYIRKVAELAADMFLAGGRPSVDGLVLAGSADLKNVLEKSSMFDPRLREKVLCTKTISCGGENGFNQAISLAADSLANIGFVRERKLVQEFFGRIRRDTQTYVFGLADTMAALEMGAVETLLVWEELDAVRLTIRGDEGGEETHRVVDRYHEEVSARVVDREPLID